MKIYLSLLTAFFFFSSPVVKAEQGGQPSRPTDLSVTNISGDGQVTITWADPMKWNDNGDVTKRGFTVSYGPKGGRTLPFTFVTADIHTVTIPLPSPGIWKIEVYAISSPATSDPKSLFVAIQ